MTEIKDKVLKQLNKTDENQDLENYLDFKEVNGSFCSSRTDALKEKAIELTEKLTLERMLKIIDKVVRGEKTSIDILREELKSNLEGD